MGITRSGDGAAVFGGSQGARALNRAVANWIERGLPKGLCVLWATGKAHYDAFKHLDRPDVRVLSYIAPIAEAYATADLALVRGGMMGSSELCAWGVPMVIVPLPTAANDHQTANAKVLETAGAARHLPESELTADRLDLELRSLLADPAKLAAMSRPPRPAVGRARRPRSRGTSRGCSAESSRNCGHHRGHRGHRDGRRRTLGAGSPRVPAVPSAVAVLRRSLCPPCPLW